MIGDRDEGRGLALDVDGSLTTMADRLFALCAPGGDMNGGSIGGHGLFFNEMRYISRWTLSIEDAVPLTLAGCADTDRSRSVLTNPVLQLADRTVLPERSILVRRERALASDAVETIHVRNLAPRQVDLTLALRFQSEFEDMFVIRGVSPGRRGVLHDPSWTGGRMLLRYDGADGRVRSTTISFDPAPDVTEGDEARFSLVLPRGGEASVTVTVAPREAGPDIGTVAPEPPATFEPGQVDTDNPLFDEALRRSLADLGMLVTSQDGARFPAAGVPWFVALFGRDSIIASLQALAYDHRLAADTLRALAAHQGRAHDPARGEEPGKILHELRVGEMATLGEIPHTPSYRTVDATPLFVCLVAEQVRWSGDLGLWRELRGSVERALRWVERQGEWIAYGGQINQGWKDSGNSIVDADGTLAAPPIALVEVQAYAYRARLEAAWLLRMDGDVEAAVRLEADARELRERFLRAFWLPHSGRLALALQAGGRPLDVLASNAGHALWAGIVDAERAATVAVTLLGEELFSGWGVRTLGEREVAYNPLDYQVGAVWPHDNALIAAGLKRYGHVAEAMAVFGAIFDAAARFPQLRLPELFGGLSRGEHPEPVHYPQACSPQAWAAGTLPYLLQTALGLEPDGPGGRLVVRRPSLPPWLGRVVWRGLRVGEGGADLRFTRRGDGGVRVEVLERWGGLAVELRRRARP
jgi:glycogen debranching enzyme